MIEPAAPRTATIIALSIATPQLISIHGREVNTAIVRSASAGPLEVVAGGLVGNQPAVHTEHVLAYPAEHYDYWSEKLGVQRSNWNWCWWGENLTVAGISEEDLHVGDVLEVGNTQLRVTSPRIPCFKVAWRVGQPDSILPKMMETGRVGFHLEVLKGGAIEMTDVLRVTRVEPDAITVAALSRLLLSQSPDDLPVLRETLALPALGLKARNAVRQRINLIEDKQRLQIGRWRGWRSFIVSAVHDEAVGTRSFYLRPQDGQTIAPPAAGQFLTVRLEPRDKGPLIRTWTISGVDMQANEYRVTVRRTENGRASTMMHESIGPGSRLDLRPPAGQFTLDRSGFRRIAMLSGGIGVTPLLAMLKEYVAMGEQAPPLLWMQVVQNGRVHPFRDEVAAMLAAAPRVQRIIWYSQPNREDVVGRDFDRAGRPTTQEVEAIIRSDYPVSPFGKEVMVPGTETEFYICGPAGLEKMYQHALSAHGVRAGLIRSEAFAPAGTNSLPAVETALVHFSESGISRQWHVDDGLTLLDLAEAAGLEPPFACRSGVCQSCRCSILEGKIEYNPLPVSEPGPGSVLICCARPASATLTLAI